MIAHKRIAVSIVAGLLFLAMVMASIIGIVMTDVRTPSAETPIQSKRELPFDTNGDDKTLGRPWRHYYNTYFKGDPAVWKIFGKHYHGKDDDMNYNGQGGLTNIVPGSMRTYYSGKTSAGQSFYYPDGSRSGIAKMYVTDGYGVEHRVYCFDYTTAFANADGDMSGYSSIKDAGIPTDVISEELIMNMAKAVAALSADNFALMKAYASEVAKTCTWRDPQTATIVKGNDSWEWDRSNVATQFENGDLILETNTITKEEVIAMLTSETEQGTNAREFLLQWMVWDVLNNWYIKSDGNSRDVIYDSNCRFLKVGGGSKEGDDTGHATAETSLLRCPQITWDSIINFGYMFKIGVEHYEERVSKWEKQYDFKPDQTITVTGDEAKNLIATYDAAGNGAGLYDKSIIDRFEIDRATPSVTMHASATIASAYDSNWCSWLACGDGLVFSTSGGEYKGNGSKGEETVKVGPSGSNGGVQFTVNADALKLCRVRFTVEPSNAYVTVHKDVPDGHSANGAEYGVYPLSTCEESERLGTLTIGPDGNATTPLAVDLHGALSRDVFIKETKVPTESSSDWHWEKDEQVYTATLTLANTAASPFRVDSHDDVVPNQGYVTVHKSVPIGRRPDGAEYTVYPTSACTDGTALGKLIIGANGDATEALKIMLSGGASKDVWIKETKAPTENDPDWHWVLDKTVYKATVEISNTADKPYRVDSENSVLPNYGFVQVQKRVVDATTALVSPYSPAGAVYGVYSDKDCHNELGRVTIGANNYSDKLKVVWNPDEDGKDVWIKEISLPAASDDSYEWVMDETVYSTRVHGSTTSIKPEDQPVEVIRSTDPIIEYGWFRVRKGTNTAYTDIVKDNSLYSVQHTRFVVYALTGKLATDPSGKTKVGEYETDADGWIDAQRVPVGTYRVEEIVAPPGHKLDIINEYDLTVTVDSTEETPVVQVFRNRPAADPFAIDFDKEWGKQNP